MILSSFRLLRPRYEARQDDILKWLAEVHTRAERAAQAIHSPQTPFDDDAFQSRMARVIKKVCCGSDRIATRGYSAADRERAETEDGVLYDVSKSPVGAGMSARTDYYAREVATAFERLYADDSPDDGQGVAAAPPDDMIHVTCTGYVSPSGAQRLVADKHWGQQTRVTHAYHMGCYAAVPALRIATGFARSRRDARVDVVHTELCSLHFDPSAHTPEQLVVQSLFADGHARYTVREEAQPGDRGFEILAIHEVIAEGSADAMKWSLGDHGMRMSLSREIPATLMRTIRPFVADLFEKAGVDFAKERGRCVFAVHPGGPKIIDVVRDALELDEAQVAASRSVLMRYGNMSSATLPHIWHDLAASEDVEPGAIVTSVAFGPGLTFAGALLRKL